MIGSTNGKEMVSAENTFQVRASLVIMESEMVYSRPRMNFIPWKNSQEQSESGTCQSALTKFIEWFPLCRSGNRLGQTGRLFQVKIMAAWHYNFPGCWNACFESRV